MVFFTSTHNKVDFLLGVSYFEWVLLPLASGSQITKCKAKA